MPCREVRSMLLSWLFPYRQKDGFPCPNKGKQPAYACFSRQRIDQIIFAYPIGFANLTFDQIPFYGTPEFFFGTLTKIDTGANVSSSTAK